MTPRSDAEIDIHERFALAMVRLSRRWRWRLDQRLRATGLTQARWTTLLQIARGGDGLSQRRLAEHIGIEGPTLVRLLNSLEQAGLIERRPDPNDGRAKTVHLTERAAPLLAEIEAIAERLRHEVTGGIPPAELARCVAVFETVSARLDSLDSPDGPVAERAA